MTAGGANTLVYLSTSKCVTAANVYWKVCYSEAVIPSHTHERLDRSHMAGRGSGATMIHFLVAGPLVERIFFKLLIID
mgnify:FL=1